MANRYLDRLRRNFRDLAGERFCTLVGPGGATTLSWDGLERDCAVWGAAYRAAGLAAGDQALIFLRHTPELYGSYFGAMLEGLTPSFMPCSSPRQDPGLYWASHAELMRHIQPAAVVADAATFAEMAAAGLDLGEARRIEVEALDRTAAAAFAEDVPEEATALLQHSSGTTGLKKGVALSYRAITEQVESYAAAIGLDGSDAIVSWLPLYHDMGLIACCVTPAYLGTPIVHIDPFHWLVKPGLLFDHLQAEGAAGRAGFTWLPNFAFDHLAAICGRQAAQWDLKGVRAFINCSEPCKPASFDRFLAAFEAGGARPEQLQCCYAMAESVFAVRQTAVGAPAHRTTVAAGSLDRGKRPAPPQAGEEGVELVECGQAVDGIEVRVLDEAGDVLPAGTVGEIALSGRFMFEGYNRDPARTAERMKDGLYRTNDLGFVDADGRLYVLGRLDDLIIINGRNLYAHEVEAVANKVAGVKPGRVVAMSEFNERVGSEVLLIAAEQRTGDERPRAEIQRDIQTAVHSVFSVVPHRIVVVDEGSLVKTTSGKISRKENLARFGEPKGVRP